MRILYIHQYFNTHHEAGGSRSYSLAKALAAKGHSVVMLTSNRSNPELPKVHSCDVDGIKVIYIKNRYSNRMGFLRRIFSFVNFMLLSILVAIRLRDIDLVFATSTPLTVGIPGMIFKRIYRVPFVFEVRDLWPELAIAMGIIKNRLVISGSTWLEKKIYHESDHIISLAPGITRGIVAKGYPQERISLVPNGCDLDLFEAQEFQQPANWQFSPEELVLVYAGTHGLANGLQWVIDVAREAHLRSQKKIKFVLIGDGMTKPGLIRQKERFKLDNVIFLDPLPKLQLVHYIAAADMGMQLLANIPSFYYGTSPNKFFDYLAAGKPVLNNYPGWVADLILEWQCGIVVKPDDYDDFFRQIEPLIGNHQLLKTMGKRARQLAMAHFRRDDLASRFVQTLEKTYYNSKERIERD